MSDTSELHDEFMDDDSDTSMHSIQTDGLEAVDPFVVDHSYLGEDLGLARSKSAFFTPGSVLDMPVVLLPDLVIFPGETLPLRMLSTSTLQLITNRLRNGNDTFALINSNTLLHVGTIIQIERVYEQGDMHLSIVGRGRQRFELIERFQLQHIGHLIEGVYSKIKILPDFHAIPAPLVLNAGPRRKRPRQRLITFWSATEYAHFDGPSLVTQAKSILLKSVEWNSFMSSSPTSTDSYSSPSDPTRFSYWLAGNLNLGLSERQRLLSMCCVIGRLRALIIWLQRQTSLIQCAGCNTTLADTRDIFLKQDADDGGPVSTFVNPYGTIHQILTLRTVSSSLVFALSDPTLADTWFPGYTWQCISCRRCSNFLGWRYESTIEQAHPRVFFGLLRKAIS